MKTTTISAGTARRSLRPASVNLAAAWAKSIKFINKLCPWGASMLAPWAFIDCAAGDPSPMLMIATVTVTIAPLYLPSSTAAKGKGGER